MDKQAGTELVERIHSNYEKLRKSERLVADFILSHLGKRLNYSITEFADKLEISEATISRFTRSIGYAGYSDLKLSMAAASSIAEENTIPNIPSELSEKDSLVVLSQKLMNALINGLGTTQKNLDYENLEHAVDAIHNASKVVLVGVGGAAEVCDEAVHLLLKIGIDAASYCDGYTQTIVASTLPSDAVMIGISHTGETETVAKALIQAKNNGASTIAITSAKDSIVAQSADHTLLTWHNLNPRQVPLYGDFLEGRVCQLYLIDLIYLALMFRRGKEAKVSLELTRDALEKYYQGQSFNGGDDSQ
ncbi:MurR/RpiR family transcriptional regulator [Vibrio nigripulchritudo]|uniref:MurR/RpiR family transcriptional regulator n=1 Tax=Vibrio nigripulchritudo TaxID=28173 RepID=UPI0003B24066|nr:MurR/RpiR family transcriptional regulator [Vibrio nigripulchritudo]CCN73417.1 putative Sialic acid utilization regulator,RpiR family [Vibrio nigripulchritudo SFn118]